MEGKGRRGNIESRPVSNLLQSVDQYTESRVYTDFFTRQLSCRYTGDDQLHLDLQASTVPATIYSNILQPSDVLMLLLVIRSETTGELGKCLARKKD